MSHRLDVRPIAEEIVELIVNGQEDGRLQWDGDGSVRVLIGKIIPNERTNKQTLLGRRKRSRTEVERLVTECNWRTVRENVYAPPVGLQGGVTKAPLPSRTQERGALGRS